jgi:hypothetical protein
MAGRTKSLLLYPVFALAAMACTLLVPKNVYADTPYAATVTEQYVPSTDDGTSGGYGNYNIWMKASIGTGKIRWRTEGWTIHRIDVANGKDQVDYANTPYTILPREPGMNDEDRTAGKSTLTSTIQQAEIERVRKNDPTLASELEDQNKPCAYELNSIITVVEDLGGNQWYKHGGYNEDKYTNPPQYWGELYSLNAGYVNGSSDPANANGLSSDSYPLMLSRYGFKNDTSIQSHFHVKYFRNKQMPQTTTEASVDTRTDSMFDATGDEGRDYPEVYTYHTSDQFDVGRGIPSSEQMKNGFGANLWYGTYSWGRRTKQTKAYRVKYTIRGWYWDEDNDDHSYHHHWRRSGYVTTYRSAYYYAITKLDIEHLQKILVQNGSYGSVEYNPDTNLPVTAFIRKSGFNANDPVTTFQSQYSPKDSSHIQWPAQTSYNGGVINLGESDSDSFLNLVKYCNLQEKADNMSAITVKACNDSLVINGKTYIDGSVRTSHVRDFAPDMPTPQAIAYGPLNEAPTSGGEFKAVHGSKIVKIPAETQNGKYPTTLTATYERVAASDGLTTDKTLQGESAILNKYKPNEPVVVHTPVISPLKIKDGESKTQLIHQDNIPTTGPDGDSPAYKLLLDGTYTLSFEPKQWFRNEFGEESVMKGYVNGEQYEIGGENPDADDTADRYDKYVQAKRVRFPFPVEAKNAENEWVYYPLKGNYTDWIVFPSNTMQFYIPTWDKESTTIAKANNSDLYEIQVRVEAINAIDEVNDHREQNTYNTELDKHVATYSIYANVSGRIYGFQIIGTNDKDMFLKYSNDATEVQHYPFALNKEEKKAGTLNRLGHPYVRYTLDGTLYGGGNTPWPLQDTVPLRPGSSHTYSDMGVLWKGTTFSYSVKTIANLGDDGSESNAGILPDEMDITPTYRYVGRNSDGTFFTADQKTDGLLVYYSDSNGNFIQYGDGRDQNNVKSVTLSNPQFKGSWYQGTEFLSDTLKNTLGGDYVNKIPDHFSYTAQQAGISNNQLLNRSVKSYTVSSITLNPKLRLLTGDPEELERNEKYMRTQTGFNDYTSVEAKESDGANKFHKSMQTWYGQYTVPDKLYLTTQTILDGYNPKKNPNSPVKDSDGNGHISLNEYANAYGLSNDSPIWLKDGYLILNFDIKTKNGGVDHLQYGGKGSDALNMWQKENHPKTVTLEFPGTPDPKNPDGNPTPIKKDVPLDDGDIAIIDITKKLTDKYTGRIFMIN